MADPHPYADTIAYIRRETTLRIAELEAVIDDNEKYIMEIEKDNNSLRATIAQLKAFQATNT